MEERSVPWWRKALHFALDGIRSGFGLFARPAKSNGHHDLHQTTVPQEKIAPPEDKKEEPTSFAPSIAKQPVAETGNAVEARHEIETAAAPTREEPAAQVPPEPEAATTPESAPAPIAEIVQAQQADPIDPAPAPVPAHVEGPSESAQQVPANPPQPRDLYQGTTSVVPNQPPNQDRAIAPADSVPEHAPFLEDSEAPEKIDPSHIPTPENESAQDPIEQSAAPKATVIPLPAPAAAPVESNEPVAIDAPQDPAGQPTPLEEESLDKERPAEVAPAHEAGKTGPEREPEPDPDPESQAQKALQHEVQVHEVQEQEVQYDKNKQHEPQEPSAEPATAQTPEQASSPMEMNEHIPEPAADEAAETDSANAVEATPEKTAPVRAASDPAPEASVEATPATSEEAQPDTAPAPTDPPAHKPLIKLESRDNEADLSPFSVIVAQVYDGPLDLLLDLIRKQDIDIYDIPIARITAQFLAYVNQLKATDVDVAGEFIYTASLLIHIKSKMLLPRAPSGPDDAAEDPRRELVERLLEHERFKNAAQMLQQKQMLEAASWSNPGIHEFRDDVSAEPEIAADTVDLVRIFRDILERARNRPVINVQEDSVTVGQMIQFLARRLTMEDKPVALRRLLSHTRSERALIAMFLALLELVRMQAILLRQDRAFSEIFIKKHSGFENLMNEGLANARDDWH